MTIAQTANLYILEIPHLELLLGSEGVKKKSILKWPKKNTAPVTKILENIAIEKLSYRWSGLAFAILAVFSRERLDVNWDNLKYSDMADSLSAKWKAGIYIFSIDDEGLLKLKNTSLFYSLPQIDEFAIEFAGDKPRNPEVMKDAVELLNTALSKMTADRVVLLEIR